MPFNLTIEGFTGWLESRPDDILFGDQAQPKNNPISSYLVELTGIPRICIVITDIFYVDKAWQFHNEPAPDWAVAFSYLLYWEEKPHYTKEDAMQMLRIAARR